MKVVRHETVGNVCHIRLFGSAQELLSNEIDTIALSKARLVLVATPRQHVVLNSNVAKTEFLAVVVCIHALVKARIEPNVDVAATFRWRIRRLKAAATSGGGYIGSYSARNVASGFRCNTSQLETTPTAATTNAVMTTPLALKPISGRNGMSSA